MPYSIKKSGNKYIVSSPQHQWVHSSKAKAETQMRLLYMLENRPSKKKK